jgi:hypothetical protein
MLPGAPHGSFVDRRGFTSWPQDASGRTLHAIEPLPHAGRSGLRVSPLCLGAMTFGEDCARGAGQRAGRDDDQRAGVEGVGPGARERRRAVLTRTGSEADQKGRRARSARSAPAPHESRQASELLGLARGEPHERGAGKPGLGERQTPGRAPETASDYRASRPVAMPARAGLLRGSSPHDAPFPGCPKGRRMGGQPGRARAARKEGGRAGPVVPGAFRGLNTRRRTWRGSR